jgi:hypothetical protein
MRASLQQKHRSLANAANADFMVLLNSVDSRKIKSLVAIQNNRQSIECSRYVKTAPKNCNLWNLVNYTI